MKFAAIAASIAALVGLTAPPAEASVKNKTLAVIKAPYRFVKYAAIAVGVGVATGAYITAVETAADWDEK